MEKLKPCPFCEWEDITSVVVTSTEDYEIEHPAQVLCENCGIAHANGVSMIKAKEVWNNRPIEEDLEKQNAALRERVCELEGHLHGALLMGNLPPAQERAIKQALKGGESS